MNQVGLAIDESVPRTLDGVVEGDEAQTVLLAQSEQMQIGDLVVSLQIPQTKTCCVHYPLHV